MLGGVKIRLATINDLPAIEKVEIGLFDYAVKPDRTREFLNDPRHHLILAYYSGKIIGMASAFHYVHPDKDPTLFMNEIGVLERYQDQGIGRAMARKLYDHVEELGCTEVWVATESSNIAARKAFTAAGGAEDKELVVLINFKAADKARDPGAQKSRASERNCQASRLPRRRRQP